MNIQETYAKAYFQAFLLSLLLCLSPLKSLAFISPFVFMVWFITVSRSGATLKKLVILLVILAGVNVFYLFLYKGQQVDYVSSNGILSFIFYASFLILWVVPANILSDEYNYARYAKIIKLVLLVEGILGIVQKVLAPKFSGNLSGDIVQGTIHPFAFISGEMGFGNQMFAINVTIMLLFLIPAIAKRKKDLLPAVAGFFALVLASVGHVFYSLLLAVAVAFCYLEFKRILTNIRLIFVVLTVFGIAVFSLYLLDPAVAAGTAMQYDMFMEGDTPKVKAVQTVYNEVFSHYPSAPFVGLGPGQYSSRAGIIASGTYGALSNFFKSLPFLEIGLAEPFNQYVLKHWVAVNTNTDKYGNSTMYRPFFSLLSIVTEFGVLFSIIVILLISRMLKRLKQKYQAVKTLGQRLYSTVLFISVVFFVSISAYENYMETAQAVFPGLLLLKVLYCHIFHRQPAEQAIAESKAVQALAAA